MVLRAVIAEMPRTGTGGARKGPRASVRTAPARKGPSASATAHPVGTTKKGNDGGQWVVTESSAGTRRWARVKTYADAGKARSPRAKKGPAPLHSLLFCEPMTYRRGNRYTPGVRFSVSDAMYPSLLRAPKAYHSRRGAPVGNAYLFGPRYPLDEYLHVGYHGNDAAQTGFIDLAQYDDAVHGAQIDAVLRDEYKPKFGWADRPALRRLRRRLPHIVWLGETTGGDVGADLWVHSRTGNIKKGGIDSIIVDNNYFFRRG